MIEQVKIILNLYSSPLQTESYQFADYERKKIEKLFDLINENRSKYVLKIKRYSDLMNNIFYAFKFIPIPNY